jgi:hypothetical protein
MILRGWRSSWLREGRLEERFQDKINKYLMAGRRESKRFGICLNGSSGVERKGTKCGNGKGALQTGLQNTQLVIRHEIRYNDALALVRDSRTEVPT